MTTLLTTTTPIENCQQLSADPDENRRLRGVVAAAESWSPDAEEAWWQAATGTASRAELAAHLAEREGGDAGDRRPGRLADPSTARWVEGLAQFLRAQSDAPADAFTVAGYALLPELHGLALADRARAEIATTLAGRLSEACQLVTVPDTRSGWLAEFELRPALARVIGVMCAHWQDSLAELFLRLATDRELLSERLWDGADPGTLTAFRGDAGDRHGNGRSVALLYFGNGSAVVYKPKELRHVVAFQDLIEFVNRAGQGPLLATRRVLPRGEYGWEELVRDVPVEHPRDFHAFYHRLGMLTRLVQLLSGRDMWADNLIAAGSQPMLIDLECLLFPTPRPLPGDPTGSPAGTELDTTVVTSAMVMQPWSAPQDLPVYDVGCLSRAGDLCLADGRPLLPLPQYRPYLADGTQADPWQYADEVIAGYTELHHLLVANQAQLLAADGPLAEFKGAWVRHIRRNTWDCYKIIRASVTPGALASTAARETALAALLRWPLAAGQGRADLLDVALAEIDAFRDIDIPLFGSRTDSTSIFSAHGAEIPDHFDGTSWDRLRGRVGELPEFDLEWHLAVLSSCVDAARAGTDRPGTDGAGTDRPGHGTPGHGTPAALDGGPAPEHAPEPERLLTLATGIVDGILSSKIGDGWIGQVWYPVTGLRNVELLGPDLGGTAGFAVLFAELWTLTGDPALRAASTELLDVATTILLAAGDDPGHQRIAGHARTPGGYYGPGAVLYALARCGERLGDQAMVRRGLELVPAATAVLDGPRTGPRRPYDDVPCGLAGVLLNLLRLRSALSSRSEPLEAAIERVVDRLGGLLDPSAGRGAVLAPTSTVPTGLSSIADALDRAAGTAADRRPDPGLAGLLAEHERTGRWFVHRYAADRVNLGLLDGTGGIALRLLGAIDPAIGPLTTLS